MENRTIVVSPEDAGKRIDIFLNEELDLSRSYIKTLIEKNNILVNSNEIKKAGYIVKDKDVIFVGLLDSKVDDFNNTFWIPQIEGAKTTLYLGFHKATQEIYEKSISVALELLMAANGRSYFSLPVFLTPR